jgi:lipoprotein-releasing system ATP-binding protein
LQYFRADTLKIAKMIVAESVSKKYGKLPVLENISLRIEENEFVAVTGASGAGKSTFLHILSTLDKADSGQIFLSGTNMNKISEKKLAQFRNEKIGFVFQFHNLLPEFTALENISIPALIMGADKKEAEKKARFWLEKFNLTAREQHKPSELSGGEQQRVAVARALVNSPKILFADEPTGNLDAGNAAFLHQLLNEVRISQKITVVVVTHNDELAKTADRNIVMSQGKIIA